MDNQNITNTPEWLPMEGVSWNVSQVNSHGTLDKFLAWAQEKGKNGEPKFYPHHKEERRVAILTAVWNQAQTYAPKAEPATTQPDGKGAKK